MVSEAIFVGMFENGVPTGLLKAIGALAVSEFQQSFRTESFDGQRWPERYPNQSEPFLSVAGAVQDWRAGRAKPKANRFQRRPVLRDIGTLFNAINSQVVGSFSVEAGVDASIAPYGAIHNFGLTSKQTITDDVRKRLAKWLKSKQGKLYRDKVGFLFQVDELETQVVKRQFVGVTKQLEKDVAELVKLWVEQGGKIRSAPRAGGAA